MKKIFIFAFISLIVFLVSLSYYKKKQKDLENVIKNVESVTSDIEQDTIKSFTGLDDEKINDSTGNNLDKEKELEKLIANQLIDIDELSNYTGDSLEARYKRLYFSYIDKNNIYAAIKSIKKLISVTKHKDVWKEKLVELYIKVGDFKNAEKIAKELITHKNVTKNLLLKYLYIKIQNTNFFDEKQVKELRTIISIFYKKKILSLDDLTFYNFLIDLLYSWDIKKLSKVVDSLIKDINDPVYRNIFISIKNDLEVYKSNKGAPLYYFKALVALDLLKYGYFGISKNISESIYIQDDQYILPKQILAYSYFYMGNYKEALKYFHLLKEQVEDENDYNFFIAISYYWLGKYEDSLLYFSQIKDTYSYFLDVLRYKFLTYKKIHNEDKAMETIKSMLNYSLSYVDYYNILRYVLFTCKTCYKSNLRLIVNLLKKCYLDVGDDKEYVCWYGKANLFYKLGKVDKSIKYFKLLTKYFQDPYIYEILANYYFEKGDLKKARFYYLKELLYTSDSYKRDEIKEKIKDLYINK